VPIGPNTGISANYNSDLSFSRNEKYAYGTGCYFVGWRPFGFIRDSFNGEIMSALQRLASLKSNGDILCPGTQAVSAQGF
jgi:hypothetical protein